MNRKLQPGNKVLRIHVLHIMKRKPLLHECTVTVGTAKYRLVEIPNPNPNPNPPGVGLTIVSTSNATIISKEW